MKRFMMPNSEIEAPNIIQGMMRIARMSDEEIRALVKAARDAGIDFFDHADIYGDHLHHSEERFAQAMQLSSSERERVTIQTKVGIATDGGYYDHSYEHIMGQVESSLKALQTDYIDVLLLHRPDALVEPEDVAKAFDELHSAGKVRYFGVSNHTPLQIELLKTAVTQPIIVNQMQMSITHAPMITQGIAANMAHTEQSVVRDGGGLIDYCRLNGITIQAWSPFQNGKGAGLLFDRTINPDLNDVMDQVALKHGVEPEAIATAWLTRHPANIQVVLGSTNPARVTASAEGSEIPLTRPEWYSLLKSAGAIVP